MNNILLIAIGGAIGSVSRYGCQKWIYQFYPHPFPFGTFVVNLVGCFVMGAAVGYADRNLWFNDEWRILITAGFCGGFTTFSAFAFENVSLLCDKNYLTFAAYVFSSVVFGIAAALLGLILTKG